MDVYYLYKGTNGVALAWSSANWETFGGQFESVATNLLLAENANIADWTLKNGKITSQNESEPNVPTMILDGANGFIKMNGINEEGYRGVSELRDEGLFIESEGLLIDGKYENHPWAAGNTQIVKRRHKDSLNTTMLTAYYGKAINTSSEPSRTYGGYFENLFAKGLNLGLGGNNTRGNTVIGQDGIIESVYMVQSFNTTPATIEFPPTVRLSGGGVSTKDSGKLVIIHNIGSYVVIVKSKNIGNMTRNIYLRSKKSIILINCSALWFRLDFGL